MNGLGFSSLELGFLHWHGMPEDSATLRCGILKFCKKNLFHCKEIFYISLILFFDPDRLLLPEKWMHSFVPIFQNICSKNCVLLLPQIRGCHQCYPVVETFFLLSNTPHDIDDRCNHFELPIDAIIIDIFVLEDIILILYKLVS